MPFVSTTQNMPMNPREVAFNNLNEHFKEARHLNMRQLFEQDKDRFNRFSLQFEDILLDYSKNLISSETLSLLLELAKALLRQPCIEFGLTKQNHLKQLAFLGFQVGEQS